MRIKSKLKRHEITAIRVVLVRQLAQTTELNNEEIGDVFQVTRENVRKLLARPTSKVKKA